LRVEIPGVARAVVEGRDGCSDGVPSGFVLLVEVISAGAVEVDGGNGCHEK